MDYTNVNAEYCQMLSWLADVTVQVNNLKYITY